MPANLTPQYIEARSKLEHAKDAEEKIELLMYMLAIIPKHKGTNKLIGELRSKLANARKEAQSRPSKRKHYDAYHVVRQGAGQVAVIGFPNVGKSKLVSVLTHAHTAVAPYPFTTEKPVVGMMRFENINIQLIDTPPITADFIDPSFLDLIRRVDLILLVVDIGSDDALDQMESVTKKLSDAKIKLTVNEIEEEIDSICKKAIVIANKSDLEGSQERLEILKELYSHELPIVPISAETQTEFDPLKRQIFDNLDIIRVYTKPIGKKPDLEDPVILYRGSIVVDAAEEIHKDFAENLKFAKIWGGEYNGHRVSRDHPLEDGNILEFHVSE